jgi:uncharacterized lipoprotein YddW (UPF0748 family)
MRFNDLHTIHLRDFSSKTLLMSKNILVIAILFLSACSASRKPQSNSPAADQPKAAAEFRAAWVATVANINWPSKPGLPVEDQQKEAIALLDFLKDNHFNAVIFQVRPQADALY